MVATLLLILIAVAAAAALYLFVNAFQANAQKNIGNPNVQPTLTIGGSSTLLPLDATAVQWFEQNNSNVDISNNQGGSGAGLIALCNGDVNIAPSSEYITQATGIFATCLSQAEGTRIGTGAVEILTGGSTSPGINAFGLAELRCVYAVNGGVASGGATGNFGGYCASPYTAGGLAAPSITCPGAFGATVGGTPDQCYEWSDLPVNDTTGGAPCTAAPGSCGTNTATPEPIQVYGRADSSGFMEGFIDQLLATSCSGNLIINCFPQTQTYTGEPALVAAERANPNGLGFISTGYAGTLSVPSTFTPAFQGCSTYPATATCNLQPSALPATQKYILSAAYQGWRPLIYYTLGTPTATAAAFIQFEQQPYVNAALCNENDFIPYSSGAPSAPGQY